MDTKFHLSWYDRLSRIHQGIERKPGYAASRLPVGCDLVLLAGDQGVVLPRRVLEYFSAAPFIFGVIPAVTR